MGSGGERVNMLERLKELNATTGKRKGGEDLGHWADREKRENMWVREITLPLLIEVAEAAVEVADVARLREDDVLPRPEDDPKLWTARMQTAWDELDAALAKLEGEVLGYA